MIHHGDLFDVLPTLEADSFDACVTDPPYGIGFMGKQWDTFKPGEAERRIVPNRAVESDNPNLKGRKRGPASSPSSVEYDYSVKGLRGFQRWTERWAREVYRVLKPGAYIVVCGAPRSHHRMMAGLEDAGFEIRDCLAWLFGQGFPKSLNFPDGWGTALKPAHEPIALARKPFKGSVGKNREAHGTGALNIDGCRIGNEESAYGEKTVVGRWPANVCLDESAAAMLDEQSGELVSGANPTRRWSDKFRNTYGTFKGQAECRPARGKDIGGASRFYYVAKPSNAEREAGLTGRNLHPTVKPVELMRWLVRLVTPPGGLVLDPFAGSGTTGMACAYEGMRFVGIEREAEYVAVAERRIASCLPLLAQEHTA